MTETTLSDCMLGLKEGAEGVVVYYHTLRSYTKHTFKNSNGKWNK